MPVKAEAPVTLKPTDITREANTQDAKEFVISMGNTFPIGLGVEPCRPPVPMKCTQRCHIGELKEGK